MIRKNSRLRSLMVVAVTIPLAFVGGNFLADSSGAVIKVGSSEIGRDQFNYGYQQFLENMRTNGLDVDNLSPELQEAIQQRLVSSYVSELLELEAVERKTLVVSDEEIGKEIAGMEDFQEIDGNFSKEVFDSLVTDERAFISQIRKRLVGNQFTEWFDSGSIVSERSIDWYVGYLMQKRQVSHVEFPFEKYRSVVTLEEGDMENHYSENLSVYVTPERGKAAYFIFDLEEFSEKEQVSDEEIELAYEDLVATSGYQEQRRISHILLTDENSARASEIVTEAQAAPSRFGELAREHSEDPGSSSVGGDLGFIARGDLDPALEEVAFGLEIGEVSIPVRSEFGLHLLMLTDVSSESSVPPLKEIAEELERSLRIDKAAAEFEGLVEQINERLFIEVDRLELVASEYGLSLSITEDWLLPGDLGYDEEDELPYPFGEAGVMATLFSSNHTGGESTELLPIGDDSFVALQMTEYEAAQQQTLEEVEEKVRESVIRSKAGMLASEEIIGLLNSLRDGEDVDLDWSESVEIDLVGRDDDESGLYSESDLNTIALIDMSFGLPAYTYSLGSDSIRLLRLDSITTVFPDEEILERERERVAGLRGELERLGYLEHLSNDVPIVVNLE